MRRLDLDDLNALAGPHRYGYIDPTDADWELCEEAAEPFLADLKRLCAMDMEEAGKRTLHGILLGLYGVRDVEGDVLGAAPTFRSRPRSAPSRHGGARPEYPIYCPAVIAWEEPAMRGEQPAAHLAPVMAPYRRSPFAPRRAAFFVLAGWPPPPRPGADPPMNPAVDAEPNLDSFQCKVCRDIGLLYRRTATWANFPPVRATRSAATWSAA